MRLTGAARHLEERGEVYGHFAAAGMSDDQAAPGVLRWSTTDGATLKLIGPLPPGWPTDLKAQMAVHGRTLEGHDVTLLRAYVSRVAFPPTLSVSFRTSTLVLDEHIDADATWDQVVYQTANLHEWLPEVGYDISRWDDDSRGRLQHLTLDWTPPETRTVEVAGARLRLAPRMETEAAHAPDWSLRTSLDFIVDVKEPLSLRS